MSNIITTGEAKPAKIDKETAKKLRDAEELILVGLEMKKCGPVAVAAGIELVRNEKLYLARGHKNCEDYCESFGVSRRTLFRNFKVAEIARDLIASRTGEAPESITLDKKTLNEHFGKVKRNITLTGIIDAARDLNTLENYLSGAEIKNGEIAKILGGTNHKALPETTESKPPARPDIFERMKSKGYVWNKETRQFENPDGSPLTKAQIGELVEESDVTKFFESTRELIDTTKRQVKARLESFGLILESFIEVSHNPATLQKFEEEAKSLLKSAEMIKAEIFEGLPEND